MVGAESSLDSCLYQRAWLRWTFKGGIKTGQRAGVGPTASGPRMGGGDITEPLEIAPDFPDARLVFRGFRCYITREKKISVLTLRVRRQARWPRF